MTNSLVVRRLPISALILSLALIASSCAHGLAFVQDQRLEITSPKPQQKVTLPFALRWTMRDFQVTGPDGRSDKNAGYFAVFLDRTPVPPGEPLSWIARDDTRCKRIPGCPDAAYLAERHVYSTTEMQLDFALLPDTGARGGHETHEISVVLLDGRGLRLGENAWHVTFFYDRKSTA
jgi:hypothetical protein